MNCGNISERLRVLTGACSMKASLVSEGGEAAAATEWEEVRETARVGVSTQS